CLVTRGVDEGELALLIVHLGGDLVGTDVLGDAAGLATADVALADGVQQTGLTVVDVTHDGDHRRARTQVLLPALVLAELDGEGLQELAVLVLGADDLDLVLQFLAEQDQGLVRQGLSRGGHLTQVHHDLDERGGVDVDLVTEVRERGATGQTDRLVVAARNLDAAEGRCLEIVELLTPLLPRLACTARTTTRTPEGTGGTTAATATTRTAPETTGATTGTWTHTCGCSTATATTTGTATTTATARRRGRPGGRHVHRAGTRPPGTRTAGGTGPRARRLAAGRAGARARGRTGLGSAGSAPRTRRATGTRATLLATGRTGTRARTRTGLGSRLVRAHAGGVGRERVVTGARTGRTRTGLGSAATATLLTTLRTE